MLLALLKSMLLENSEDIDIRALLNAAQRCILYMSQHSKTNSYGCVCVSSIVFAVRLASLFHGHGHCNVGLE